MKLSRFYCQELAASDRSLTVVHRRKQVLDATDAAHQRGIKVGMGLAEAKTLLGREAVFVEWQEEVYRAAQYRWLDTCATHSDTVEPVDQHEAFVDLSAHPNPQLVRANLIEELRERTGCTVRSGCAHSRWIASLALGYEGLESLVSPKEFIAQFPVHKLPVATEYSRRLNLLGCQTIGDVAAMPREALRQLFRAEAVTIERLALGQGESRVDAEYPPDSLSGRFTFEGSVIDAEVFDNGLKHIAKHVGLKLATSGRFGKSLEMWLEDEEGTETLRHRTFSKPIASPASLLVVLRLLCGTPQRPVVKLRVRLSSLQNGQRVQRTLDNLCEKAVKEDASKIALSSIRTTFGDCSITRASDLTEPRWRQVRRVWRAANGWVWR